MDTGMVLTKARYILAHGKPYHQAVVGSRKNAAYTGFRLGQSRIEMTPTGTVWLCAQPHHQQAIMLLVAVGCENDERSFIHAALQQLATNFAERWLPCNG